LILAAVSLVSSATLIGLRLADGHDPVTTEANVVSLPSVIVYGSGSAEIALNGAAVVIGVDGSWPSLEEGLSSLDDAIQAAIAAGVAPADVHTLAFSVTPAQIASEASTPGPSTGVAVRRSVALLVRDLGRLNAVLAAVTTSGVAIEAVGIGMADPSTAYAAARDRAMADARAKADTIARSLATSVLHAEEALEFEASSAALTPLEIALRDPAAGPPPATGQVEVRVQITFSLR
jgi:uncharacterized protein YggE